MDKSRILIFLLWVVLLGTQLSKCEIYSAVSQLKILETLEVDILDRIDKLLVNKSVELKEIEKQLKRFQNETKNQTQIAPEEGLNPLDAYHRFKRLWKYKKTAELIEGIQPTEETQQLPGKHEFDGAIEALIRLRKAYLLPVDDLASGIISSNNINNPERMEEKVYTSRPLNANDCHRIAKYASNTLEDYVSTVLWAEAADKLIQKGLIDYDDDPENDSKNRAKFLNDLKYDNFMLIGFALRQKQYYREALQNLKKALALMPKSVEHDNLRMEYEVLLKQNKNIDRPNNFGYERPKPKLVDRWAGYNTIHTYEALCRGEKYLPESNYSSLSCFYMNPKNIQDPYYKLWKIKVEEAGKYPHIVQFHDTITDEEIEVVKRFAEDQLERAKVGSGKNIVSRSRVSQNAWAKDNDDPVFRRLSQRIEAFTGLSKYGSESLQIGNYGLGGHYEPHIDQKEDDDNEMFDTVGMGNRIATWMFYLSDVELGGATVFSSVGITVWPRKGSAAFWYNLRSSQNSDPLTRHAGCPVLIGSKWVANKWFHVHHQEFRKQCPPKPFQFYVVEEGHH